ncbi:molybdopterin-dependent oxidoreductase [Phenylobacterium sp. LjRoot219]|uniref:molybdopterin-containing oxidoreductase family protein n=1 Tax=Phenylobacterium sp. LjRoot219 TaxID=3342283 RepID=UPI003ECD5AA6
MQQTVPTICRLCPAHCGVLATVVDGRLAEVRGDPDNPLFKGYTCPKGRALPELHNDPERLLHSQKRQPDGGYAAVPVSQAMDEIAAKLQALIATHGPRSVAIYTGTNGAPYPASAGSGSAFLRAIGSPMFFTPNTIDQPGKQIAAAAHGHWLGGDLEFESADSWLLVGLNPVISKSTGVPARNPAQKLKDAVLRGMKLIVVDPRRTETAKRAAIHIQPRPGEDPTILAGLLHVIIAEKLYDQAFVAEHVTGLEALAAQVADFTPDYVARRAEVPAAQLIEAARLFATYGERGGMVHLGTGPSFATHGNLAEYLALCLTTLCGRWPRAGEAVHRPNAMLPAYTAKAQAMGPYQGWGYGERLRVRGLTDAACGLPTAALADEILLDGEGQVRALVCIGSNPMAAWPDQRKTQRALEKLELLVTLDVTMSLTSRLADYVVATKMTLETPGMTQRSEMLKYYTSGIGFSAPYAQYSPRIVEPPAGSDLIEEWEVFHGLAKRLDRDLTLTVYYGFGAFMEAPPVQIPLGRNDAPTTEELFAKMCASARIPFEEVCRHPHGQVFEVDERVQPKDADCRERLDVGAAHMMDELAEVAAFDFVAERSDPDFPFRLIPRRANNFLNSTGLRAAKLHRGKMYNPTFMHPDDMAALDLQVGDRITLSSRHDRIPGVVEADASLRRGVVTTHHCFGGLVDEDDRFMEQGGNVGRLVANDAEYDPITGIPRMGNVPVQVTLGWP